MDDRKLLELAARAASIQICFADDGTCHHTKMGGNASFRYWEQWNPLRDDGDALRLAVALGLKIAPASGSRDDITEVYRHSSLMGRSSEGCAEKHGDDALAATRRAIVRAAANMGSAIPQAKG